MENNDAKENEMNEEKMREEKQYALHRRQEKEQNSTKNYQEATAPKMLRNQHIRKN